MGITTQQIEQLKAEAGGAGDSEMVDICRVALGADPSEVGCKLDRDTAWAECEEAIEDAQAQQDA